MTGITRKPAFWIVFALTSLAALWFALRLFPQAIPLVNLDVKMTRQQAITEAGVVAEKLYLAPQGARSSVRFAHDGEVQNFVELEAGGKSAFAKLLSGELYSPYWWEVRLFAPGDVSEARVRFKPDGSSDGFYRRLPESAPGAAIDADAARAIAESAVRTDWGIDLAPFTLIEQSQTERPGKRIDHTLVYERKDAQLGDGRYRMRLAVSGDSLTELTHYVHVPAAFRLRYAELRATNETIARVATLAAGALYGIGGCILAVLWLLRSRWLLWKPALIAGLVVALLNAVALLLNAPAAWFGYDTAQSTAVFWGQLVGASAAVLIGGGLALALVFMAAESLSRRAFPRHPQLWRVWSRESAPTPQIAGRTLGGMLFVPLELALISAFYYVSNRYFGWWQPSESLTDPNILGSYLPAMAPIALSLQAGFMEESLFRAVPLSIAALLGERFGHRRAFIASALVLQALVFGAAHANYPGFPAYSRLIELILPSLLWGLIFLRFGLLPTAILHALFDLALFSIPLFLVEGPGSDFNRALVVGAAMIPLLIVLWQRFRVGLWRDLPERLRNGGWQLGELRVSAAAARVSAEAGAWSARTLRALPALGVAGLIAIVLLGDFQADVPPLKISRQTAELAAEAGLRERGVALSTDWQRFSATRLAGSEDPAHKFVWREAGPAIYRALVGTWLAPPLWEVRYARFSGVDVVERSEEWRVTVDGDGKVRQIMHVLPEKRPGARLAQDAARRIAQQEIVRHFGLDPGKLREISAEQKAQPERLDWGFTYADPTVTVGPGGEARLLVSIAGDEVVGEGRYVFVPESWRREERNRAGLLTIVKIAMGIVGVIAAIAAMIALVIAWTHGRFDRRMFRLASLAVIVTASLGAINQWPAFAMRLQTTEPLSTQIGLFAAAIALGLVVYALLAGLLAGVASYATRSHADRSAGPRTLWLRGVAAALFMAGCDALLSRLAPDTAPSWPSYKAENAWLPWVDPIFSAVAGTIATIAGTIVVLYWLDRLTAGWTRRRSVALVLLVLIAAAGAAAKADDEIVIAATALIDGAVSIFLFATVLRYDLRIVPPFIATNLVLASVSAAIGKGTLTGAVLAAAGIITTLAVAFAATRYLWSQPPAEASTATPTATPPLSGDPPAATGSSPSTG